VLRRFIWRWPDGALYVTAPTLSTHDAIYRIAPDGTSCCPNDSAVPRVGFDAQGACVVEALAGAVDCIACRRGAPELVLAGPNLIGVAFDPAAASSCARMKRRIGCRGPPTRSTTIRRRPANFFTSRANHISKVARKHEVRDTKT
jgi:hypothetical protein